LLKPAPQIRTIALAIALSATFAMPLSVVAQSSGSSGSNAKNGDANGSSVGAFNFAPFFSHKESKGNGSKGGAKVGVTAGNSYGTVSAGASGSASGSGASGSGWFGFKPGFGLGFGQPAGTSNNSGSLPRIAVPDPDEETGSGSGAGNGSAGKLPKGIKLKKRPLQDKTKISPREQVKYNEHYQAYQERMQKWAAGQNPTGPVFVPPGNGRPITPPIVGGGGRIPLEGGSSESGSSAGGGGGGGGSAGAGMGFLPNTSGLFMQQMWNKMHQKSATCDAAQQRAPEGTNPNSVYASLPSADRTMRQPFIIPMNGQSQDKKSCGGGGPCGNSGEEGNYNNLKPQEPPQEVTTSGNAIAQDHVGEQFAQDMMSPQTQAQMAKAGGQSQCQGAGEACAAGTCEGLEQALMVMFLPMSTVNVANEAAGTPGSTLTPFRPLSQAIWMVQKMYKQVFMPMALLLLLPGALVLHIKVMIQGGIRVQSDEDAVSPFSAIMRSMIAVFLIPATQLIVSYASDIGSSMTHEVSGAVKVMALVGWAKTAMGESMTPLNGEATGISNMDAGKVIFKAVMNTVTMTLAYGLLMLIAFQITIMCYLMCMGPIAAAFYVYPTGVGRLFKPVFANWVDAVINIALWKFWWCVIVLCMVTRINVMTFIEINPTWEAYMFVCFLVMMSYVPFCPFECKPGEMVDKILQKAQELKKSAGDQNG